MGSVFLPVTPACGFGVAALAFLGRPVIVSRFHCAPRIGMMASGIHRSFSSSHLSARAECTLLVLPTKNWSLSFTFPRNTPRPTGVSFQLVSANTNLSAGRRVQHLEQQHCSKCEDLARVTRWLPHASS